MLKHLTRSDWLHFLSLPEDRVPQVLLLRGTRNLRRNYERHAALLEDVLEVGSPNGLFEDLCVGRRGEVTVAYASVYGDAMASEITHVFGVLGTRRVIQTGCCGALGDGILPGDLICATSAGCGEGAAQYYTDASEVAASEALVAQVADWAGPVSLHRGPIWTTSALLAEGREEIARWRSQGYLAVDMETASTFAVAQHFGMERLSLLFAFDNPAAGDHILLTDDAKTARRVQGERAMLDLALDLLAR